MTLATSLPGSYLVACERSGFLRVGVSLGDAFSSRLFSVAPSGNTMVVHISLAEERLKRGLALCKSGIFPLTVAKVLDKPHIR